MIFRTRKLERMVQSVGQSFLCFSATAHSQSLPHWCSTCSQDGEQKPSVADPLHLLQRDLSEVRHVAETVALGAVRFGDRVQ